MGYILPITHHTYKNYQARMSKGDERPFYVGQTQPVFLSKLDQKVKGKRYYALLERDLRKDEREKRNNLVKNNSELTGKGKYINERV